MAPLAPLFAGVLAELAKNGLGVLAKAIEAKGKEVVEEKLGVKIPDDPAKLSPELLQQLQIKQMEHEEFLVDAALEETKAFLEDRKDARARDVEFIKAGKNNVRGDFLAYGAIGSLFVTILLLFLVKVPAESRDILLIVLGGLIVIVKDVYGFEFGSSKDSARQQQAIVDTLRNGNGAGH